MDEIDSPYDEHLSDRHAGAGEVSLGYVLLTRLRLYPADPAGID